MDKLKSIVVGVDFSSCSGVALAQAARIGAWNRSSVTAVHVIDSLVALELDEAISAAAMETGGVFEPPAIPGGVTGEALSGGIRQQLLDDTRSQWTAFAALAAPGAGVDFRAVIDGRSEGIIQAAKIASADLLVLGATGAGQANVGLGTVATACVRKSPCSVLLVREDKGKSPFKTVVCCVDFSKGSMEALETAARLATQDSASLRVLHVFYAPWHVLHYRSPTPETDPVFRQQYMDGLRRRLEHFGSTIEHDLTYLKPTFELVDAPDHRNAIPEYLAKVGADLVVLGTRGHSNLRDFFLGSTAEKVLRDAHCSVLAVRTA